MAFLDYAGLQRFKQKLDVLFGNKLDTSLKGAASGVAELNAQGKVPYAQNGAVMTINGRSPDSVTGDITVIEGGGSSTIGAMQLDATIATSAWISGDNVYTATIANDNITANMLVSEVWLDDDNSVSADQLSGQTAAGSLTVVSSVLPTASVVFHAILVTNGSDVIESNLYTQAEIATVQTGATATENIAKGQYVSWNNVLYQNNTGSAIASGSSLSGMTAVTGGLGSKVKELSDKIPTVVNNLTSSSTTDALSAAQGKALNDNKTPISLFGSHFNHASLAYNSSDGAQAVYNHFANGAVGVCLVDFASDYHCLCIVVRTRAEDGAIIILTDYSSKPIWAYKVSGTWTIKTFTTS